MGIACALGALLVVHLTRQRRASTRVVRIVAAALLPPIAVTLYLTFSRGAIWVLPLGFVLYVLLAQPRGLLTGLPAAGIPAAIAAKIAYGNELLARADYDSLRGRREPGPPRRARRARRARAGAAALRAAALPLDRAARARSRSRRTTSASCAWRCPAGSCSRCCSARSRRDAPRRISDARATFSEGRYMDYSADLRDAADLGGRQRPDRQLARRARRLRRRSRCTAPAPARTGSRGTADRPPPPIKVNDGHSLYLEMLSELGVVGLALLLIALGTIAGRRPAARLGGPERHAHGAFVAAGAMLLAARRRSTGTGRCPRCSCGCSARAASCSPRATAAARRARAARRGSSPRWRCSCSRSRRRCSRARRAPLDRAVERVRAARLRRGDRRRADRHRALRRRARSRGWCSATATRGSGQFELARRAMDAARSRDPDNWQYAYGQAIVYGVSGARSAPVRRRGAAAQPARPAGPRRSCATCAAAKTGGPPARGRAAGRDSAGVITCRRAVRRRRTRPPASSARPPSRTGIAAKPVNGSSLVWAAAACWRSACVSSAGSVPPPAGGRRRCRRPSLSPSAPERSPPRPGGRRPRRRCPSGADRAPPLAGRRDRVRRRRRADRRRRSASACRTGRSAALSPDCALDARDRRRPC